MFNNVKRFSVCLQQEGSEYGNTSAVNNDDVEEQSSQPAPSPAPQGSSRDKRRRQSKRKEETNVRVFKLFMYHSHVSIVLKNLK